MFASGGSRAACKTVFGPLRGLLLGYKLETKNSAVHNLLFLLRYETSQRNVSGERLPQRGTKSQKLFGLTPEYYSTTAFFILPHVERV
jgi:hypothetical protein